MLAYSEEKLWYKTKKVKINGYASWGVGGVGGRENRVRLSVRDGSRRALVADQLGAAFASCEGTGGHASTSGRRESDPPGVGYR